MMASKIPSARPMTAASTASTIVVRNPAMIAGANWYCAITGWRMFGLRQIEMASSTSSAPATALVSHRPGRRSGTTRVVMLPPDRQRVRGSSQLEVGTAVDRGRRHRAALDPVLLQNLAVAAVRDQRIQRLLQGIAQRVVRLADGNTQGDGLIFMTGHHVEDLAVARRLGQVDHHR